jgi:hypothetical protein
MKTGVYGVVTATAILAMTGCKVPKLSGYADHKDLSSKARYDVSKNVIRDNGRGFTVDFAKLKKPPVKIALVSFYVEDPGITKKSGTRSTGQSFHTTNSSQEGVQAFANYFYKVSIGTLDQTFKTNGMDVMKPSQFLTTEAQKEYYKSFEVRHSSLNKLGGKLTKFFKKSANAGTSLESKAAADGYTLCNLNTNNFVADAKKKSVKANGGVGEFDDKLIESMGYDLCKELNVDAVLVVTNTIVADNKHRQARHFLSAVSMYLFGPNPLPLAEGKKDNMFYSKGLFYSGYRMAFKKGLCIDPRIKDEAKKTENEKKNDQAYNNMIASIAGKMSENIKDK